ncbi:cytochrome b561 [Palleronia aestuarii]|uniref:Cytochrome b561 n=1 Tax=Palleronia aestuarii TaxID=568105 RepID=A0A2W7PY33_9RHOB|nr:cytochrome b [Palleronia aestuarii]PZX14469.1 cytochrome b561 [Palleronia aestuarii]
MTHGYATPARLLHWTTALLVFAMVAAGIVMTRDGISRPLQDTLFIFHKNAGVAVMLLVLLRVGWRMADPPGERARLPAWQERAAALNHAALYLLLFVMPLSGYIRVRAGGFPVEALDALGIPSLVPRSENLAGIAQGVHFYAAWALGLLVALHVAAALYHSVVRRDAVLARMWPPIRQG